MWSFVLASEKVELDRLDFLLLVYFVSKLVHEPDCKSYFIALGESAPSCSCKYAPICKLIERMTEDFQSRQG